MAESWMQVASANLTGTLFYNRKLRPIAEQSPPGRSAEVRNRKILLRNRASRESSQANSLFVIEALDLRAPESVQIEVLLPSRREHNQDG